MLAIFAAITIVITKLLPLAGSLAVLIIASIIGTFVGTPPPNAIGYGGALAIMLTHIPGAIVAYLFIHFYRLKDKLPKPVPGRAFLLLGITLAIAEPIALVLPGFVSSFRRSDMTLQLVRMVAMLSTPFLVIGLVKVLLATRNTISPSRPETTEPQEKANAGGNADL